MSKINEKKDIIINSNDGITLIALVITIIVLLILARSKYSNVNRTKWIVNTSK